MRMNTIARNLTTFGSSTDLATCLQSH